MKFNLYPSILSGLAEDTFLVFQKSSAAVKQIALITLGMPIRNIATLKAVPVSLLSDGVLVKVSGYDTPGDGGGGNFIYDADSTETVNLGTVFAPNSGSGRYIRTFSGDIDVGWFGAKGDGLTDDTAAIQSAIDFCGEGKAVYLPVRGVPTGGVIPGRYMISTSLIAKKGPTNGGAWGTLILKGDASAAVDDILSSKNYGSTIMFSTVAANTPVLSIDATRSVIVSDLNIAGSVSKISGSVGVRLVNRNQVSRFVRVNFDGWDQCAQIGDPAALVGTSGNNDETVFDNCRFGGFSNVGIANYGVESYLQTATDCKFDSDTAYRCYSDTDGTAMTALKAFRCDFNGSVIVDVVSREAGQALYGRDVIVLDSCIAEPGSIAASVPYLCIFKTNAASAVNPLGFTARNCIFSAGDGAGLYTDPSFALIKYKGRGPFVFENNICGAPGRMVFDLAFFGSGHNDAAGRIVDNYFTTARLYIRKAVDDLQPLPILIRDNLYGAEAKHNLSDPFLGPYLVSVPDAEVYGVKRAGIRDPLDTETWLEGSTYIKIMADSPTDHYCWSPGTVGTIVGVTATVATGATTATIDGGAIAEQRKIYPGCLIAIGAANALRVRDVIGTTIYLQSAYGGATQSGQALSFFAPVFRRFQQNAFAAPATGTWSRGDSARNALPAEAGAPGSAYTVQGWNCTSSGTPGTWLEMRVLTGN